MCTEVVLIKIELGINDLSDFRLTDIRQEVRENNCTISEPTFPSFLPSMTSDNSFRIDAEIWPGEVWVTIGNAFIRLC